LKGFLIVLDTVTRLLNERRGLNKTNPQKAKYKTMNKILGK